MVSKKKVYKGLTVQQKNALFTEMKTGVLTAPELAKKYGVSERTIHRYRKDLRNNPGEILATTEEVVQSLTEQIVDGFLVTSLNDLAILHRRIMQGNELTDVQKVFALRDTVKIITELKKTISFTSAPPELNAPTLNLNFFIKYLDDIPKEQADLLRPVVMGLLGEPIDAQATI